MSHSEVLTINIDGASRGNPGPAAFAYVIRREGQPVIEEAGCLPRMTNNSAEYTALVRALEHASRLKAENVVIRSDSELLVKQMRGEYRVKHPELRLLYEQADELRDRFRKITFVHVPREENRRADQLCNLALDGKRQQTDAHKSVGRQQSQARKSPLEQSARDDALTCLGAAATAWSRGDPEAPTPSQVLDQIWSILDENGLLKSRTGHRGTSSDD
jgi:ribonuclease HI